MRAHIGIVGCSAEGAALCFRTICAEGPALFGAHEHPEISIHVMPLADYVRSLEAGDLAAVGALMLASAHKLVAAGADVVICPDNTIHAALDRVAPHVTSPWLHIADVVADAAVARGYRRVGLLGTRWLVLGDVYPARLAARGIELVLPAAVDVELVHRLIMEELVPARASAAITGELRGVIARLADAGCDAVLLGCTELPLAIDDTTSPLPTLDSTRLLARAALRWTKNSPVRDAGAAALHRLHARVATTQIRHTLKEAKPEHTRALIALLFGYGYARLAQPERARERIAEARYKLPAPDPVHAWLIAAFEERIAQALACAPRETPWSEAVSAQLAALSTRARYMVDRLREVSTILEPVVAVDAIKAFKHGWRDSRGPDIERLARLAEPERAVEIARLIELAATRTDEDERLLGGAFDHLLGLPAVAAIPIWTRATALVAEAPLANRATLYTRALVVASYFDHLAVAAAAGLVVSLRDAIAYAPIGPLGWALARALPALQMRDRRDDVVMLVAAFEARAAGTAQDLVARAAHAGALAWLGELGRAETIVVALRGERQHPITSFGGRACAWFPPADRARLIDDLAGRLPTIGDNLSTNSHFALSVLDFVEGLVLGAIGS